MSPHARTLVAVVANRAGDQTHTLYFNDGTIVTYDPVVGRVLRVHQLPADLDGVEAVLVDQARRPPAAALPSHLDRRQEGRD